MNINSIITFVTRYKKLFIILGFALITILLGFIIFTTFLKPFMPTTADTPIATTTPTGNFPIAQPGTGQIVSSTSSPQSLPFEKQKLIPSKIATGGVTKTETISEDKTSFPSMSSNGKNIQYYNKEDNKFYKLDENGKKVLLSDKEFYNVDQVTWSPSSEKAILEYPDGSNILYDFDKEKQVTLQKHWKDFDFAPSGDKIVMKSIGLDPNNRWLAVSNPDGTKFKPIEPLGEQDTTVYPSWSENNQMVAMYTEGVSFDRQEVFFVGLNGENFKSTVIEGRGFQPKWSEKGDKLLYSVHSSDTNMKPSLWIVNAQGDTIGSQRKSLKVETWAEKCVFANNSEAYCAVPEQLPEGAGWLPELAKNSKDNLYKININSGMKQLVAIPENPYNMSNLMVSDDGKNLFFTDNIENKTHKILLK